MGFPPSTAPRYNKSKSGSFSLPNDTQRIPIYKEFATLVGCDYALVVLLNQICYSNFKELSISKIREATQYDGCDQTLRRKLDKLVQLGLVSVRKNTLYGIYMYSVTDKVTLTHKDVCGFVNSKDLRYGICYDTAALLNKFELKAKDGITKIELSATDAKKLLNTKSCRGKMRTALKTLESHKLVTSRLVGRRMEYTLDCDKLQGLRDEQTLTELSGKLSQVYHLLRSQVYRLKSNDGLCIQYQRVFYKLLSEGYDYRSILQILAYSGYSYKTAAGYIVHSIKELRDNFDIWYELAFKNMGRRRALRYIYKLEHDLHGCGRRQKQKENKSGQTDADIWGSASAWVTTHPGMLYRWWTKHAIGLVDVDFEDFQQSALLELHRILYNGHVVDSLLPKRLEKRLQDLMFSKRPKQELSEQERAEAAADEPIYKYKLLQTVSYEQMVSIGDELELACESIPAEDVKSTRQLKLAESAGKMLVLLEELVRDNATRFKCNPLVLEMLKDKYGYNGKEHTLDDLVIKYNQEYPISRSTIRAHILWLEDKLRSVFKPPD